MTPLLFDLPRSRKRRFLMHVSDAGGAPGGGIIVCYRCARCGAETRWQRAATVTAAKRGVPCDACNAAEEIAK